ncbi:MAG: CHAT domain-containing protein [Pyrinomonadaceae bacterium]
MRNVRLVALFLAAVLIPVPCVIGQNLSPLISAGETVQTKVLVDKPILFTVNVGANEFFEIKVDYDSGDIDAFLENSSGEIVYAAGNLSNNERYKSLFLVSEPDTNYRLKIAAAKGQTEDIPITVSFLFRRIASEADRKIAAAEKAYAEGELLQTKRSKANTEAALEKYREAVGLFREAGATERESYALSNLGFAAYSLGNPVESQNAFEDALAISRSNDDKALEARMLNNLGNIYLRTGRVETALETFNSALPIVRELGLQDGEGSLFHNIASIHKSRGDNDLALEAAQSAERIFSELGKLEQQAGALNSIGSIHSDNGNGEEAFESFNRALELLRRAGNRARQAVVLNNLGVLYSKFGDKARALDVYKSVLEIVRESGNKVGEAGTLNNIGSVERILGNYESAIAHFTEALALRRATKDKNGEAVTLTEIATIKLDANDIDGALSLLNEALEICRQTGARRQEMIVLHRIGQAYARAGKQNEAAQNLAAALKLSEAVGDHYLMSGILASEAELSLAKGDSTGAIQKIENALEITESYRAEISNDDLRASYLASVIGYYKLYTGSLMKLHQKFPEQNYAERAFGAAESAKARVLLEALSADQRRIKSNVPTDLLEREKRTFREIKKLESERLTIASKPGGTSRAEELEKAITGKLAEYSAIRSDMRKGDPNFAGITEARPASIKEIQALLDSDTVLIEYSLGKEKSFGFMVTDKKVLGTDLPSSAEIEAIAGKAYKLLSTRATDGNHATETKEALGKLARILVKPFDLDKKKRVIIVSDGILQLIPFAALPYESADGKKAKTLLHRFEVVNLPSASTLTVLRKTAAKTGMDLSVAVVADPVFSPNDPRVAQTAKSSEVKKPASLVSEVVLRSFDSEGKGEFPRLRFSRTEAGAINSLVPESRRLSALDFEADKDLVTGNRLKGFNVIHFATHGVLNNSNPELSGLVLSLVGPDGGPKNGFLRLYEIYNLDINPDLVVLSACRTALGKDQKGEGVIGLTRGFMYAGADRVISTLWMVEDRASAELMKSFYRSMIKEKLAPAEALRKAQLELANSENWSDPYYWSAFTINGDWK